MQPFKRPLFICSAIEKCQEKVNCCAHKLPHIKDERCVPRECRYAPGAGSIDCDPYDPEHPRVPIPEPVAPAKTVEQVMREKIPYVQGPVTKATVDLIKRNEQPIPAREHDDGLIADLIAEEVTQEIDKSEHPGCDYPTSCTNCPKEGDPSCVKNTATQEIDIKEAVKKQAVKPVQKKGSNKKKG